MRKAKHTRNLWIYTGATAVWLTVYLIDGGGWRLAMAGISLAGAAITTVQWLRAR